MFDRIYRSIALVRASWRILMQDKKLLAFPILSGIITLIVIASFILPILFTDGALSLATNTLAGIIVLFLFYLVTSFVVIFFNVGLVACVYARLQGETMPVGEGLRVAMKHLGAIFTWAVISATVGLVLRIIEDRAGAAGGIVTALVGGAWSLVTLFVVPVLIIEEKGVTDAIRDSWTLFKKTWGESVVGSVSITLVFVAVGMLGLLLVIASLFSEIVVLFMAALVLVIVLVAILAILASAMQGIFIVALYIYARTGEVPGGFDRGLVSSAFSPKTTTTARHGNI